MQRILGFFGLGGEKADKKGAAAKNAKPASPKQKQAARNKKDRKPKQPTQAKQGGEKPSAKKKRTTRAPEKVEVTGPRLYVGNLSYDTTEEDLTELFSGVGGVESAEVVTHTRTQRSKGFAFVVLRSVDEAKRAVEVLHDQEFMGRKITVSGAKSTGPSAR